MKKHIVFFYFLSFLEGSSVMATELIGAKMLAPYYGTSLYVWSAVLGITLAGLALGYFLGGLVSVKKNVEKNLYYILLLSSIFLIAMPSLANISIIQFVRFQLVESIMLSAIVILFPPVFCMGMVSPLIVTCVLKVKRSSANIEANNNEQAGKVTGTIYAISTLGGILATFLLGFYIIPTFGLTQPAIYIGLLLGVIPFYMLVTSKQFVSFLFPLVIFFAFTGSKPVSFGEQIKIHYTSEGVLGQIIVADYPLYESETIIGSQRILFVNRSTQTIVTKINGQENHFEYVNLIKEKTADRSKYKNALILGLGGGSLANELSRNLIAVEAVELDSRMEKVAKAYFNLSNKVSVYNDDARHFVKKNLEHKTNSKKIDVIVLDAFVGEVNPHHLFTKEFFAEVSLTLTDSGVFFINGNGYWKDHVGIGMRSICKTLLSAGFNVEVLPTEENEDYRNIVLIAKKSNGAACKATGVEVKDTLVSDGAVLVDEYPKLEILNAEANLRWRNACMKYYMSGYYTGQDRFLFK